MAGCSAKAGFSQAKLAHVGATGQSAVAAYEQGSRSPTLAVLERLLAACGQALYCCLEPANGEIDRLLDGATAEIPDGLGRLVAELSAAGDRVVVGGVAAAALHGLPVLVERVDLVVHDDDAVLDALLLALGAVWARPLRPDGETAWYRPADGADLRARQQWRWWSVRADVELRLLLAPDDPVPAAVRLPLLDGFVPVLPLGRVEVEDRLTARLLGRWRERSAAVLPR